MKRSFTLLIASFIVASLMGQSAIKNNRLEGNRNQVFKVLKQITRNNENLANPFSSPNDLKQAMDSTIYEEFHEFDDGWRNDNKDEYYWDESGKETMNTQSGWNVEENIWVTYEKSDYSYDGGGRILIINTKQLHEETFEWIDWQKTEFTYDRSLGITAIMSFWHPDLNQWVIFWKYEYIFDNDGNISEIVNYYNEEVPTNWLNGEKYEYFYDGNGKMIQELWLTWDSDAGDWSNEYKIDYSYEGNGNLISENWDYWNTITLEWISESKAEFAYDNQGNISEYIESWWEYDIQDWLVEEKVTYTYNNTFTYDDLILPSNYYGYFYSFEAVLFNHMLLTEEVFEAYDENWDEDTRTTYYYSENNSSGVEINIDNDLLIYPNPATDYFTIDLKNGSETVLVEIYDTYGRMVSSKEIIENQTISVSDFVRGIYVYKFVYNGNLFSGKILVQ